MWTFATFREHAARSGADGIRLVSMVQRQPSWITRATVGAAILVFTGVVLLLVIPAMLVAAAVFGILSLAHAAVGSIRAALRLDGAGRRNVRVITRR